MLNGINIGTAASIAGIRRLSVGPIVGSPESTSWEDGNCGNPDRLYFTFTDFLGPAWGGVGPRGIPMDGFCDERGGYSVEYYWTICRILN